MPTRPAPAPRRWPLVLFGIVVVLKMLELLDALDRAEGAGEITWAFVLFLAPIGFFGYVALRYRRADRAWAEEAARSNTNS